MPPRKRKQPRGVTTPLKSLRPYPPENWDLVKAIAKVRGETITEVVNRALTDYIRKYGHVLKESRDSSPDTEETK